MEIKMKAVSNLAAGLALTIVLASFVLNTFGITNIDMTDALKTGGFIKAVFLPVDTSVWINNIFCKQGSNGGIVVRDDSNK
jgi:hypothetical protein